jgi:hypothetical protein
MDDEQHHDDILNNTDMISHTSHKDDVVARPPSATFSSLRKLVDSGASFCLPSPEKLRRSCSKSVSSNTNNISNHQTPRGAYDDSETDDDGNGNADCVDVRASSLLVTPASSIIQPTPSSLAAYSTTVMTPGEVNFCSSTTPPDALLFRHPQDFFAKLLQKTPTSNPVMMTPTSGGIPGNGMPVSPIPFSSDSAIVEEGEQQDKIAEKSVSRSIFPELEEQQDDNDEKNDNNDMVVASDKDNDSANLQILPAEEKTAKKGKVEHEIIHKSLLRFLLAASSFWMLFVGGYFVRRHQMDLLDTAVRQFKNEPSDVVTFQTMMVVTEMVVEEAEPVLQGLDAPKDDLTPSSNDEASHDAETGGTANVPAIEGGEDLEPEVVAEELVVIESRFEEFPVVQSDSIEHEPVEPEDVEITPKVGSVDDSEAGGTGASDDVKVGDAETEDTEQPKRIAAMAGGDHSDGVSYSMGKSFEILADDIASEEVKVITFNGVAKENYDDTTGDAPERGESTPGIHDDTDDITDNILPSLIEVSLQPDSSLKQAGSKPKPLVVIENAFKKLFRTTLEDDEKKEKDQDEIEAIKASLEEILQSLQRDTVIFIDQEAANENFYEFEADSKHSKPTPFGNIKKTFGNFLRRKAKEIVSDE